jgi:hypothetical protein
MLTEKQKELIRRMESAGKNLEETGLPEKTDIISGNAAKTLNSTITELFPCIAFLENINETDPIKFYQKITEKNNSQIGCYINNIDAANAEKYIKQAPKSVLFEEKIKNAMAVLKYIRKKNNEKTISKVYWSYRLKPNGIEANHPADIFIKYSDGTKLGISIKTGQEKTKEPLFNTFVKPVLEYFEKSIAEWNVESYNKFYSKIVGIGPFSEYGKPNMINFLGGYEKKNRKEYNKIYDEQLEWIRSKIINLLKEDTEKTKKFILEKIAPSYSSAPLILIKAIGNDYQKLSTIDIVRESIQTSKKIGGITIKESTKSKQDFHIELKTEDNKTTKLLFSIRTNKSGNNHKLGQFVNLAFKFNGID